MSIEPKDWPALANPDPEWEETVRTQFNGVAPDFGRFATIEDVKAWVNERIATAEAALGEPPEDVLEEDIRIPTRDGSSIAARIHKPTRPPASGSPLYVMFHGGGFCLGGLYSDTPSCRVLVQEFGFVVVNVDYRLGPEFKFPAATNDSWDATQWAAKNAISLGADPAKGFLVGGGSAGGNLAAGVCHQARDANLSPPITGSHYMIPSLGKNEFLPSRYRSIHTSLEQNEFAPILSQKAITLFQIGYNPTDEGRKHHLYSIWLFPTGHAGLPPSYFQVCGLDPLRDDGLLFEKILREEHGIRTKLVLYPGQPHGFNGMAPKQKATKKWNEDFIEGVRWLLEQGKA